MFATVNQVWLEVDQTRPTSSWLQADVANVGSPSDQWIADLLRSIADNLRSPAFPSIWEKFLEHMHIERLPADAEELLRSTSTPRQELVLGYRDDISTARLTS